VTRAAAPRFAALDIGTTSVKFLLAAREQDGWRTLTDRAVITRLGEGLDRTGAVSAAAIERTVDAIAEMVAEARAAGAEAVAAVGTAGLRLAANAGELIAAVRERAGVTVEVIDGAEEARFAYAAAIAGLAPADGPLVVFETGGGSAQFSFGDARGVTEQFSVDVGAERFTARFGLDAAVPEQTLATVLYELARELGGVRGRARPTLVIGIGGAAATLAAVKHGLAAYDGEVVHGSTLELAEIDRQIELYRTRGAAERRAIAGLEPDRADVILAGACIVRAALALLGAAAMVVSDRGLRHGLLEERFAPLYPGP
jgi:exopolyphosphatase/guanosine-5'-triphosphate,3'-diphosphate pyrophosphatase